ncbi:MULTISPECIES: biotin--[acetyl-CoA-carboxylase] ligase [Lactobacillus]|jgi:BirA family biotin operon repressor/biotin-[acetyl-CoA-carboxylase] ligase|uniref:biotin--[acetyl-CoA-carboxylase] ligase n=1 Tax=Lactobacillus TaxID=1578 RepID=UPI002493ABDE|nr:MULTISPECIES: biotin--[acetyl-CoA-carboxylase] ligase [Lactobacillus]
MQVFHFEQVSSTQDLAKEYLKNNPNGIAAAFVADSQTNGYGKQGRDFYSPAKTGMYFSIALPKFDLDSAKAGLMTPFIAVKIVEVLQKLFPNKSFKLKWVNDIYLNQRKIAGILVEKVAAGLVVGFGINLTTTKFPKAIAKKAGSIDQSFDREKLEQFLIKNVLFAVQNYDQIDFLDEYRKLSCVIGRQVSLHQGQKRYAGCVVNIDDQGCLLVDIQHRLLHFSSGEIDKVDLEK